jgi:hypothetical protein
MIRHTHHEKDVKKIERLLQAVRSKSTFPLN